ncbi:MAG: valine--tRNA ligase [Saprospiraceae bacterium]|nr:valine--tRNA ligase [Saprospiraceae bacterium]MBP6695063.1 valine--tRNA ligase [Saprospiraceae bacterium]
MKERSAKYTPSETEEKWYEHWMKKNYFSSKPDNREPYTIIIPPPNVTGVLHMGHMLNNTIQDVLIRKARQEGKNACWVPGTDHASIATEAKVVKLLREKGIKKSDLTREEFLDHAWAWKEEYGGIILNQLKKLGASCDWDRTAFTMDEVRSSAVLKVFVDLYHKGKLYRGKRMVNWDPEAKTVLSNEEVLYANENSQLYHVKYQIEGSDEFLVIATTRPETIPGDTAIAVHPEDERYFHLHGKKAVVPVIGRKIPIIADEYVDREFGTGALKVTPAHDMNDYEIGKRHNLEVVEIFNEDATMSREATIYLGEDRFVVRKKFVKDLDNAGFLQKAENYQNNVGRSERTNAVVEPRLSLQWYVDMPSIVKPALENVMNDNVSFFPKNQKNIYKHWMENIRDWCISRQLWWGHRIPAWYYQDDIFVAVNEEEALLQARQKYPDIALQDLRQDEDVLDTWFSSWLWPISVFDGFRNKEEIDYYYPTSVLVTGWDIIFLWVARMIMAGYEWMGEKPFHDVYFTGMVRDKMRRKMSKSLGNSPDALQLIADYGADGVRFGMMSCSPAGGDLLFDEKLCEQGRNFCNKMWNALKLVEGWQTDESKKPSEADQLAFLWLSQKHKELVEEVVKNIDEYRLSEALISIYSFVWTDFCSWYLEIVKPQDGVVSAETKSNTVTLFKNICTLLHPYMPFITEELWHALHEDKAFIDCIVSPFPEVGTYDKDLISKVEQAKEIITQVRDSRNKHGIKMREEIPLHIIETERSRALFQLSGWSELVQKMAFLSSLSTTKEDKDGLVFISGTEKCILGITLQEDSSEMVEEIIKELEYQKGFVTSVLKKLENERFVSGAPAEVVEREKAKLADGKERIKILAEQLKQFNKN